jgi:hypothetical protein
MDDNDEMNDGGIFGGSDFFQGGCDCAVSGGGMFQDLVPMKDGSFSPVSFNVVGLLGAVTVFLVIVVIALAFTGNSTDAVSGIAVGFLGLYLLADGFSTFLPEYKLSQWLKKPVVDMFQKVV